MQHEKSNAQSITSVLLLRMFDALVLRFGMLPVRRIYQVRREGVEIFVHPFVRSSGHKTFKYTHLQFSHLKTYVTRIIFSGSRYAKLIHELLGVRFPGAPAIRQNFAATTLEESCRIPSCCVKAMVCLYCCDGIQHCLLGTDPYIEQFGTELMDLENAARKVDTAVGNLEEDDGVK